MTKASLTMAFLVSTATAAAAVAAAVFAAVFVAYAVESNDSRTFTPYSSLMSAMWASLFGSVAILLLMSTFRPRYFGARLLGTNIKLPKYMSDRSQTAFHKAAIALEVLLLPAFMLAAFGGLIAVKDPHGAVFAALAIIAQVTAAVVYLSPAPSAAHASLPGNAATDAEDADHSTHAYSGTAPMLATSTAPANKRSCGRKCASGTACCGKWMFLILTTIVLVGFGVQWPLRAVEMSKYQPIGQLLPIRIYDTSLPGAAKPPPDGFVYGTGSSPDMTHNIHLHCVGPTGAGRPLIAMEAGGGTGGLSFLAMQLKLADLGWRSCAIDRSGFGYSDPVPLGAGSPVDTRRKLAQALIDAGEASASGPQLTPLILVGHSAGVEIIQTFAIGAANSVLSSVVPSDTINSAGPAKQFEVKGLAFLDGYPNYLRLLKYSQSAMDFDKQRVCTALQAARAFEAVGLTRAVTGTQSDFNPPSEAGRYAATYNTGHAWYAQFVEYCSLASGNDGNGALLQSAAQALGLSPYDAANGIAWPPAPAGAPVLIMPAGGTVADGRDGINMYWKQVLAYNATMAGAGNSTVAVCAGCEHNFPWVHADWAAQSIHAFFTSRLGLL